MFLKTEKSLWNVPFEWRTNQDVFEKQEYRTHHLSIYVQDGFFKISKDKIGGMRYAYQPGGRGFIEALIFVPEWRNKGFGSLLFQKAIAEMDEAKVQTIEASVGAWNHPVIALTKKYGFVFKEGDMNAGHIIQRTLRDQD